MCNPNGMVVKWNSPKGVLKAVYSLNCWAKGTCQYPLHKSRVVIYLAWPICSTSSSFRGIGYASNLETELSFRKSRQILSDPFWRDLVACLLFVAAAPFVPLSGLSLLGISVQQHLPFRPHPHLHLWLLSRQTVLWLCLLSSLVTLSGGWRDTLGWTSSSLGAIPGRSHTSQDLIRPLPLH